MRTALGFLTIGILCLLVINGCGDQTVTDPMPLIPPGLSLTLSGIPAEARVATGVELRLPFLVHAYDDNQVPFPGQIIDSWVDFGPGSIIESPLTTNADGIAAAVYSVILPPNPVERSVVIKVRSGSTSASVSFLLEESTSPERFILSTATPIVFASPTEPAQIRINVAAVDPDGGSVPGVTLRGYLQPALESGPVFGSITGEAITDAQGMAELVFNSLDGFGPIKVVVAERNPPTNPPVSGEIDLEVRQLSERIASLELFLDPDSVIVSGEDDVVINVLIRILGENRQPLANMPIAVIAEYSAASPAPLTDENGLSRTTWRLNPGRDLPPLTPEGLRASLRAIVPGTDWEADDSIWLGVPSTPSGRLTIFMPENPFLEIDGPQGNVLTATASLLDADGQGMSNCPLTITASSPLASVEPSVFTDPQGRAAIVIDDFGRPGDGNPIALTVRYPQMNLETIAHFRISDSTPQAAFEISANPRQLEFVGTNQRLDVWISLLQVNGQVGLRNGEKITFSARKGRCEPGEITGDRWVDHVSFYPGFESGADTIFAVFQDIRGVLQRRNLPLNLQVGPPSFLSLQSDTRALARGETMEVTAQILDLNNQPAQGEIHFWSDEGSITERAEADDEGRVGVTFTAGNVVGEAIVTAISENFVTHETIVDTLNLRITGLPPMQVEIEVGSNGIPAGGAFWSLPVSVMVSDLQGQPVEDGVPVSFILDPPLAQIQNVEVGNFDLNGQRHPGVAHSSLIYPSVNTGDTVTIRATVPGVAGPISMSQRMVLPLQRGSLIINVDPANWMFNEDNPHAVVRIWATLQDGHGTPINNVPVQFTTNRSRFSWYNQDSNQLVQFFPDPVIKMTGVFDRQNQEAPGEATVFLEADEDDIFLDPFTLEVRVEINACVVGNDDVISEPRFIEFTRLAR